MVCVGSGDSCLNDLNSCEFNCSNSGRGSSGHGGVRERKVMILRPFSCPFYVSLGTPLAIGYR